MPTLANCRISLSPQTQGWDYEFERLQSFTRMESKFVPGQSHIVDEITSRFLEKERANASLLSFLHEQEVPRGAACSCLDWHARAAHPPCCCSLLLRSRS
jgi:hypothetical protein